MVNLPSSTVEVLADMTSGSERHMRLRVSAPAHVPDSQVMISATGPFVALTVNGTPLDLSGQSLSTVQVNLIGRHAGGAGFDVTAPAGPVSVLIQDHHLGLPDIPGFTIIPRPGRGRDIAWPAGADPRSAISRWAKGSPS